MCGIIKTNLTVIPQTSYMLPNLVHFTFVCLDSYIYNDDGLIFSQSKFQSPKFLFVIVMRKKTDFLQLLQGQ